MIGFVAFGTAATIANASQALGNSRSQLRDRGTRPIPLEAGTDAGGTAVRSSRDYGR